ncbi:MAG: 3-isopropylmalate dehydratase large subunit [Elusimicrobiota bacterium]
MAMTITEKILAQSCGRRKVSPGDFIESDVNIVLANDVTAPIAISEFYKAGSKKVFDRTKIVLVPDHFTPNKDIKSAEQSKILREFAKQQELTHYYEIGRMGIEHALLPEEGVVLPGDVVAGADSHTCTYGALGAFATGVGSTDIAACMISGKVWFKVPSTIKFIFNGKLNKWVSGKDLILYLIGDIGVDGANYRAIEFAGEVIEKLSMSDRFTICNMVVEAGAKSGIISPDKKTIEYVENRAERPYEVYQSDNNAVYEKLVEYDCCKIEPLVAIPALPSNIKPVKEIATKNIKIDEVVIGSCTNGRIEDLRIAAEIFRDKKIHPDIRAIIIPATQKIYLTAIKEGLIEIFINSGCAVSTPTCGPCLGGHLGVLAKGEKAITTTNRNFVGRMGHPESEVYLCNPAVAAASAIAGKIALPE